MSPSKSTTFFQAPQLPTILLLLFLFLPSLFFSLLFIPIAFLLFIPITCILISIMLLFVVLRRIRILSLLKGLLNHDQRPTKINIRKDDPMVVNRAVSVVFDRSEIPSFTESESESESEEDFSNNAAETSNHRWLIQSFKTVRRCDDKPFHEILSFWKRQESI